MSSTDRSKRQPDEDALRLCETVRAMWHRYLLGGGEDEGGLEGLFDDSCVVIGTGRHEYYENAAEFFAAVAADLSESSRMVFRIVDEWYDARRISDASCLIYGGIHVREADPADDEALIDMDTRFSVVFRRDGEGEWKIIHVHQSLPYLDQEPGEYYPRTLSERASEAIECANRMRELARHDQMTRALNHSAFFSDARRLVAETSGWWCLVIDVDDFKGVNDRWGHLEGDRVLETLAKVLREHACESDLVGRIGGDEFAMLARIGSPDEAERFADELKAKFAEAVCEYSDASPGLSVGFARVEHGDFTAAFRRADGSMYAEKRSF